MTTLQFVVPGAPVPKARPRVFGKRTITDPRTVAYEGLVRMHALKARQSLRVSGIAWPLDAEYSVELGLYLPTRRRLDGDNCEKSMLDACNAVLWDDDSQISRCTWERWTGVEEPRATVRVTIRGA